MNLIIRKSFIITEEINTWTVVTWLRTYLESRPALFRKCHEITTVDLLCSSIDHYCFFSLLRTSTHCLATTL